MRKDLWWHQEIRIFASLPLGNSIWVGVWIQNWAGWNVCRRRWGLRHSVGNERHKISPLSTHQIWEEIWEGSTASKMASAFDSAVALGLASNRGRLPGGKTRPQAKLIVLVLAWKLSQKMTFLPMMILPFIVGLFFVLVVQRQKRMGRHVALPFELWI